MIKSLPIWFLIAIAISQPSRLWVGNYDKIIHLNGTEGYTNEWAYWLIFAHYGQFFIYMVIVWHLLRLIKKHVPYTPETKLYFRISKACFNIFVAIGIFGFLDYLYSGWPEDSWVYIVGTIGGFLFTIITEQWRSIFSR